MAANDISRAQKANKPCAHDGCLSEAVSRGFCKTHYMTARRAGLPVKIPHIQDFWEAVDKSGGPDACWPWMRSRNSNPSFDYGHLRRGKTIQYAHRRAWELANDDIPAGLWVLHKCDNPPCCNPKHLFLGTRSDNVRDMFSKGRCYRAKGSKNKQAKLTEQEVRKIYALVAAGYQQNSIARRFGVHQYQVYSILKGLTWRHVPPPDGFKHRLRR